MRCIDSNGASSSRGDGPVTPGGASADGDAGDLNADAAWDIFLPLDTLARASAPIGTLAALN
jgi:hypothetical protein